ncbi:hypothetical protein BCR37DRAFT_240398 [Protomyces lactucae-debilis]|uniref:Xylanolytic transcriptional activator regulatory domain-containing protein n=1 Tax=Protomyces lactucae-debilis TaxID=2754530 RepID=A0A1Y2FNL4_PROLT|nr:uncharacterized protein BCR37DRAFT_240398 [Protomyces lactucae-debilis]ORY85519.1 hypothetical protein BCR37DRAFT_240398 [Protomyces lactucae-debilis]
MDSEPTGSKPFLPTSTSDQIQSIDLAVPHAKMLPPPVSPFRLPAVSELTGGQTYPPIRPGFLRQPFSLPPLIITRYGAESDGDRSSPRLPIMQSPMPHSPLDRRTPPQGAWTVGRARTSKTPLNEHTSNARKRANSDTELEQRPGQSGETSTLRPFKQRLLPKMPEPRHFIASASHQDALNRQKSQQERDKPVARKGQTPTAATAPMRQDTSSASPRRQDFVPPSPTAVYSPTGVAWFVSMQRPGRRPGRKSRVQIERLRVEQMEQEQHLSERQSRAQESPGRADRHDLDVRQPVTQRRPSIRPIQPKDRPQDLRAEALQTRPINNGPFSADRIHFSSKAVIPLTRFGELTAPPPVLSPESRYLPSMSPIVPSFPKRPELRPTASFPRPWPGSPILERRDWPPMPVVTPPTPVSATFRYKVKPAGQVRQASTHLDIANGADQCLTALAFDPVVLQLCHQERLEKNRKQEQRKASLSVNGRALLSPTGNSISHPGRIRQQTAGPDTLRSQENAQPTYKVQSLAVGLDERSMFFRVPHQASLTDKLVHSGAATIDSELLERIVAPHGDLLWHTYFRIVHPSLPILSKRQLRSRNDERFPTTLLAAMYLSASSYLPASFKDKFMLDGRCNNLHTLLKGGLLAEAENPSLATVCAFLLYLHLPLWQETAKLDDLGEAGFNIEATNRRWMMTTLLLNCAHQLGLNLDPGQWAISESDKHMRRRLWWMTVRPLATFNTADK